MLPIFTTFFQKISELPSLVLNSLKPAATLPLQQDGRVYQVTLQDLADYAAAQGVSMSGLVTWLHSQALCYDAAQSLTAPQLTQVQANLGLSAWLTAHALRFDVAQQLTVPQQALAYANLGLGNVCVMLGQQTLNATQKAQVLTNLGISTQGSGFLQASGTSAIIVADAHNAQTNGVNLLSAYAAAKSLTPSGLALSSANRAVVILLPGEYDLGLSTLYLNTAYVDVVGLTGDPAHVLITSQVSKASGGTVVQSVGDVRLRGLTIGRTGTVVGIGATQCSSWFFSNLSADTLVEDCVFTAASGYGMRLGVSLCGTFRRCKTGDYGFGSRVSLAGMVCEDCVAGSFSFGYNIGSLSVNCVFRRCTAGNYSFGYASNSVTILGTFEDCTAGINSFGSGAFGNPGDNINISATFLRCAAGSNSFGNGNMYVTVAGTMSDCTAGDCSFGYGNAAVAMSGTLSRCTGTSSCFGYPGTSGAVAFMNCSGGDGSFGARTNGAMAVLCYRSGALVDDYAPPVYTPFIAYVETSGNDSTGTVGYAALPYNTAQAAYNAVTAANGTVPGTYVLQFGVGHFGAIACSGDLILYVRGVGQDSFSVVDSVEASGSVNISDLISQSVYFTEIAASSRTTDGDGYDVILQNVSANEVSAGDASSGQGGNVILSGSSVDVTVTAGNGTTLGGYVTLGGQSSADSVTSGSATAGNGGNIHIEDSETGSVNVAGAVAPYASGGGLSVINSTINGAIAMGSAPVGAAAMMHNSAFNGTIQTSGDLYMYQCSYFAGTLEAGGTFHNYGISGVSGASPSSNVIKPVLVFP